MSRNSLSRFSQIVAYGGGGFLMEPENPLLDRYVLSLSRARRPRVCFVPTASGDSENMCLRFYDAFAKHKCLPSVLPLFNRPATDLRSFIFEQQIIYVGGGNTANMLAVWRVHGLDRILREAHRHGVILCGVSAGSICWFQTGVTDSYGPKLQPLNDGLGLLPGSNCPHYDGEPQRRPAYQRLVKAGLPAGYAADDGCALHFVGKTLKRVVASRRNAHAYRVELKRGRLRELLVRSHYLG
jgi:peptidase E